MSHRLIARTFAGLATALLMFGTVQAKGGGTSHFGPAKSHNTMAPIGFAESIYNFDVADIKSYGEYGAPGNEVFNLDVGANAWVTGIGWDVLLWANTPSWLSEMAVAFEDSAQLNGVLLNVGVEDSFAGLGSYSSGGIVDLGRIFHRRGGTFNWHAWAEIHDGRQWISMDPTWNEVHVDATHLVLSVGPEDFAWLNVLGKMKIRVVRWSRG